MQPRSFVNTLCALALLAACAGEPTTPITPRPDGERTPLTRACDDADPTICLLPWPSSAFLEADPSTATGVRVHVDLSSIHARHDSTILSRADGFSRVSTVVTGFPSALDESTLTAESLRVVLAQYDHPDRGDEVPLRREIVTDTASAQPSAVIAGHPLRPMVAGADYVVVVTDALRAADGSALEASRETRVSLGLARPEQEAEIALAGYHAPTRALLAEIGIDPAHVVRVWDFTTRSPDDPRRRLEAMRAAALDAVEADEVSVAIDEVSHRDEGPIATVVRGRLSGLPNYMVDRRLSLDADGMPLAQGTRDAPFRVTIPRGTGDYRILMFGHGTGGSVDDTSFDDEIASIGAAKVSIEFYGWTEDTVIDTFLDLYSLVNGAEIAAAGLVQSMADAAAVRLAMSGVIGEALEGAELLGAANPHAGRRPDDSVPMWVGGSLGGTMGLLYGASDPQLRYAVLNVAGAAWGTWVRDAYQYGLLRAYIERGNGGKLATVMMVSAAQTLLDEADGASWAEVLEREPLVALVQESIGDPVLPNPGTHIVAQILAATQVGAPLIALDGLAQASSTSEASGLTQFHVPETDVLDVHGFAGRSGPAGDAARAQILTFVESAWDGSARIEIPSGCADGSCDFTR